jgi:hypothetical protein
MQSYFIDQLLISHEFFEKEMINLKIKKTNIKQGLIQLKLTQI